VIDEATRECLAIDVDRSIDADGVMRYLHRLAAERGAPAYIRLRPRSRAHRLRRGRLVSLQRDPHRVHRPGSPWHNTWIESFNGRLRDELLNGQLFESVLEARVLLEDWRIDYNTSTGPTAHTAGVRRSSLSRPSREHQHSHSDWLNYRDPLTLQDSASNPDQKQVI
jgi:putative transposase